jgi:hypothetical protein
MCKRGWALLRIVNVGTALVAVLLKVRTGTSPVPTKISAQNKFGNHLSLCQKSMDLIKIIDIRDIVKNLKSEV